MWDYEYSITLPTWLVMVIFVAWITFVVYGLWWVINDTINDIRENREWNLNHPSSTGDEGHAVQ